MIVCSCVSSHHLMIRFESEQDWRNLATYLRLASISLSGGWEDSLPTFLEVYSSEDYWTSSKETWRMYLDPKDFPIIEEFIKIFNNES